MMWRAVWPMLCGLVLASPSAANCRQALALGLDVSGSVDKWEYRLQLDGLASAFLDPTVQGAFLDFPGVPVRVMIFEWSAQTHHRKVIDWTNVRSAADLASMAAILGATRTVPVANPSTAIGPAMDFGATELRQQSDCWQKTLDLSGDGPANTGHHPRDLGPDVMGDVVINGLVIGPDGPANAGKNRQNLKSLRGYYEAYVLRGPGSFVEAALDYQDFARAMRRKLLRELQPAAVSRLAPNGAPGQPPVNPRSHRSVNIADLIRPIPFDPAQ